jgi:uncharacterized membrane protein YdbT with pleckstrin-like domain
MVPFDPRERERAAMAGQVVYEANPAMFRARPFLFVLCVLLIAAFGIGILMLLYWYILTRATQLTVTDHDITYERGILSKDRTSVALRQVRSVRVVQGFINRIFDVGTIEISSTGDKPEFTVKDMPDPNEIRDAIAGAQRAEERGGETETGSS